MALRLFHKILIGSAVIFFLGFGVYETVRFVRDRRSADLVQGVGSGVVGAALGVYLWRFARRDVDAGDGP